MGARPDPSDVSVALERQLGLRLHAEKVPVNLIVIVHIEKPTPD